MVTINGHLSMVQVNINILILLYYLIVTILSDMEDLLD